MMISGKTGTSRDFAGTREFRKMMISRKSRTSIGIRRYSKIRKNDDIWKQRDNRKIRGYSENPENHENRAERDIRKTRLHIRSLDRPFVDMRPFAVIFPGTPHFLKYALCCEHHVFSEFPSSPRISQMPRFACLPSGI